MIYFIQADASRRIKIGTTIRLSARLKKLEAEHSARLEVLGVRDGGLVEERVLHDKFSEFHVYDEWFRPHDDLLEFIRTETIAWDGTDERETSAVRLEFDAATHERLEQTAKNLKLSKAGFAQMAVMDRLREEEKRLGIKP